MTAAVIAAVVVSLALPAKTPAMRVAACTTYAVADYGAVPSDGIDDGDAVRAAVADAASDAGAACVSFDTGVYLVDPPDETAPLAHITVIGADDVSLVGSGSELRFTDPMVAGTRWSTGSNISISGMIFDWQTPPFVQGIVSNVDRSTATFDYVPDAGYPLLEDPRFIAGGWGTIRDPANPVLQKANSPLHMAIDSWTPIGTNRYQLHVALQHQGWVGLASGGGLQNGDYFVIGARPDQPARAGDPMRGQAIKMINIAGARITDTTIYSAPGGGVNVQATSGLVIDNLQVLRRPGTNRLMSTSSDTVHVQNARQGPQILNSTFEGMQDDGITVYTVPLRIDQVVSTTQVQAWYPGSDLGVPLVGDLVEVFDPINGVARAKRTVQDVSIVSEQPGRTEALLTFDSPVDGMVAGTDHTDSDHIYNLSVAGPNTLIQGNTFRESRGHGVVLMVLSGTVENNTFDHTSMEGINIANNPDKPIGPPSGNVMVRGNTLTDVGFLYPTGGRDTGSAIRVTTQKLPEELANGRTTRQITLDGNHISNPPRYGIYLGGASGVTMTSNTIDADPTAHIETFAGNSENCSVKLANAGDVGVDGLTVTDPRPDLTAGICLPSSVDSTGVTFTGLDLSLDPAVPDFLDQR